MIYIARGTLVAMVPVAFAGDSMVQVISMGSILVLFAGLQCKLWPWRTEFANYAGPVLDFSHCATGLGRSSRPDGPDLT